MTFLNTDLIRISANCSFGVGGQDLINVLYAELISPSSLTDAQVLSDVGEVLELWYAPIPGVQNTNIQYVDYTVKNETQDAAPLTSVWPTFTVGSKGSEALPSQIVGLAIMRTAISRKFGRVNIGGLTEIDNATDVWLAPVLTAIGTLITNLLATQVATNGNYRYGVATQAVTPPRTIANSYDAPISGKVIGLCRTQRRRSAFFGS